MYAFLARGQERWCVDGLGRGLRNDVQGYEGGAEDEQDECEAEERGVG